MTARCMVCSKYLPKCPVFFRAFFNQCFMQLRHYDSQIWNICRFAFTTYITVLGAALGLYQYSADKNLNLIPAAIGILVAGLILGVLLYSLVICNRAYYVLVCRYINEHRSRIEFPICLSVAAVTPG